ncbi:MAG: zf-HC2 domain-containing protein [Candidatus Zixiibacteriota bacterium]
MRCRKARSCLSAYCSGELSNRLKPAVSEHLSTCSDCRREEALYRSMSQAARQLANLAVSADFNGKLLNRIAQARFAETRTKAFLPRRAPLARWGQVIPAFVTTSLVILLAAVTFRPDGGPVSHQAVVAGLGFDDSYLTVQPTGQRQQADRLSLYWSLSSQIERAEKLAQLSNTMVRRSAWPDVGQSAGVLASTTQSSAVPYAPGIYRVRPVVRVYLSPDMPTVREGQGAY